MKTLLQRLFGRTQSATAKKTYRPTVESLEQRECMSVTANWGTTAADSRTIVFQTNSPSDHLTITENPNGVLAVLGLSSFGGIALNPSLINYVNGSGGVRVNMMGGGVSMLTYHQNADFMKVDGGNELTIPRSLTVNTGDTGTNIIILDLGGLNGTAISHNTNVVVNGGAAADTVFADIGTLNARLNYRASLGQGIDTSNIRVDGDLLSGSVANIATFGGDAGDHLTFQDLSHDVRAGGSLTLLQDGGRGADTVTTSFAGKNNGFLSLTENDNSGYLPIAKGAADNLSMDVTLWQGSTGRTQATITVDAPTNLRPWEMAMMERAHVKLWITDLSGQDIVSGVVDGGHAATDADVTSNVRVSNVSGPIVRR